MELTIHVGYRKTATTWLQDILFPKLPLNYIAKTGDNYPDWLIKWHYADDFLFDTIKDDIRRELEMRLMEDRPNLISSEAFTNTAAIFDQARRISEIHPQSRILVTLRDPVAMVWSHYCNDVQMGDCHVGIEHWLDWTRTPFVINKRKAIYLPDFFFDEAISHYRRLFGPQNVGVLRFEDMRTIPGAFFRELYDFMGIDHPLPTEDLLAVRLNQSSGVEGGRRRRKFETFVEYMKTHFPGFYETVKDKADRHAASKTGDDELPTDMHQKLEEYFKGKCYGYY